MNANRLGRAVLVLVVLGTLTSFTVLADDPRRPGREIPTLPPLPPPPKPLDMSKLVPKFGSADRSLERGQLEIVAAALEGELQQLEFQIQLREIQGSNKKVKAEAWKREAEIKAEELVEQVRGEAAAIRLRDCTKAEIVAKAEVQRIKALADNAEVGSYRKALEALDDSRIQLADAKAAYIQQEVEHAEAIHDLRREADSKRANARDPDTRTRTEIETTRSLLALVRTRLLEIRFGMEDPALTEAVMIGQQVQGLRREVKELREKKQP